MSFLKEYTEFISWRDLKLFISWRVRNPDGKKLFQIPEGNKLYIPDKNSWY